jgi:hypothetical protein
MGSVLVTDTGVSRENLYQQERTRCSTQFPGGNDLCAYGGKYRVSICLWEGRRGPVERLGAIRLLRYHLMPLNGSEAVLVRPFAINRSIGPGDSLQWPCATLHRVPLRSDDRSEP